MSRCKDFIYGGCNGTANNFETLQDCDAACTGASGTPSAAKPKAVTVDSPQEVLGPPPTADMQPGMSSSSARSARWQGRVPLLLYTVVAAALAQTV